MPSSIKVGQPTEHACWACGQTPSVSIGDGSKMVYLRLCEDCFGLLSCLKWPETVRWITRKPNIKELNRDIVAEYRRVFKVESTDVPWARVSKLLSAARKNFTQDELLEMLSIAAADEWIQRETPGLTAILASSMLARWERVLRKKQERDKKRQRGNLEAEKRRMIEEMFGADLLDTQTEQQITMADTFEDLEAVRDSKPVTTKPD